MIRLTHAASNPSHPAPGNLRRAPVLLGALWTGLALLVAIWTLLAPTTVRGQSTGDPLVLAFYYSWFDEATWTYDKLSDLPAEPYVSRDRGVMGRHIDQARRAGIDALLLAWYGPGGGPNQTETNLIAMLDEAQARGYKIGVLFETTSPFFGGTGDATAALQHLLATHANHPAYLRADGRPVIFFWRPTRFGLDSWRAMRNQVDPNYNSIWISEGVDTSYLALFDGHHLYSNTWNPPADLNAVNAKFAAQVAQAGQRLGATKLWVATVMPGYDDVRIRGRGGLAKDREGGAYFERSWNAAIASNPSWIVINSFNEWPEGSFIEPSVAHGDRYLDIAAAYSAAFKSSGGAAVNLAPPAPMPTLPPPTPTPVPTVPTAYVNTALLNLRAGPGTDFAVVGQARSGAALVIRGRAADAPDWWQVEQGDGVAWVFGGLVTTGGPMQQVAVIAASPAPEVVTQTAAPIERTTEDGPPVALQVAAAVAIDDDPTQNTAPSLLHLPVRSPFLDPDFRPATPYLTR